MAYLKEKVAVMISNMKKMIRLLAIMLPNCIYKYLEPVLIKVISSDWTELVRVERFKRSLLRSFDDVCDTLRANRKCMLIETGDYGYSYFNVAYICNMLALILYALYKGCVPLIQINQNEKDYNKWQWFFLEPHEILGIDIEDFEQIQCDIRNLENPPLMTMLFDLKSSDYEFWKKLCQKFVVLNTETAEYVEQEIQRIGNPEELLGVLIRGTDYVQLKPPGHPVQPEPHEIIDFCKKRFASGSYQGVYVATEEKALYDMVCDSFGRERTYENRRQYYDEVYYQSKVDLIGKIHFRRNNDNYWKSIEYLSSLIILSKCKSLVAGNCGGTLFAMFMADYKDPYIFNCGVYE